MNNVIRFYWIRIMGMIFKRDCRILHAINKLHNFMLLILPFEKSNLVTQLEWTKATELRCYQNITSVVVLWFLWIINTNMLSNFFSQHTTQTCYSILRFTIKSISNLELYIHKRIGKKKNGHKIVFYITRDILWHQILVSTS